MIRFWTLPSASACTVLALILSFAQPSECHPGLGSLWQRATKVPAPLQFPPAQNWEGIDGSWNTFVLRLGTPVQTVRVMISTASQQTWAVDPRGCPDDTATNATCSESRGATYNHDKSSSWKYTGLYDLWIESNLGLTGNAEYGYDTVGLGYPGEGGPTLDKQVLGSLATTDFYFGHFGINPKPTNFTNFTTQSPSFLTTLKDQGLIPSVSWGYTAGVPYRFAKVLGSLTLGGYDSSRFIPNDISFPFAPDNERDILVSITGINSVDSGGAQASLLPKPVYSYIDSTIAEIWLPVESCVLFEKAFGLTWDQTSELYLLSEAQHNALLISNPNITIIVAPYTQAQGKSDSVTITLPYAAFDQTAKPPYQNINASSRYFPLRRATNDTEYTLGRTFLQEAYLTVDWERQNFSVAPCSWVAGAPQHILAITSVNSTSSNGNGTAGADGGANKMSPLTTGAIVGIAIGAAVIILLSAVTVFCCLRRKDKKKKRLSTLPAEKDPAKTIDTENSRDEDAAAGIVFPKAELDASEPPRFEAATNEYYKPGLAGSTSSSQRALVPVESDSKQLDIFEMEGDMPKRQEADSHMLSEKEAMRHREERINGTDPGVSPITPNGSDRSPTSTDANSTLPSSISSRARNLITPGDVIELNQIPTANQTMQLVSPLEASDGSRTLMFTNMSPMSPINDPESATRKRFSYEDP